jgi:hypothetical protein
MKQCLGPTVLCPGLVLWRISVGYLHNWQDYWWHHTSWEPNWDLKLRWEQCNRHFSSAFQSTYESDYLRSDSRNHNVKVCESENFCTSCFWKTYFFQCWLSIWRSHYSHSLHQNHSHIVTIMTVFLSQRILINFFRDFPRRKSRKTNSKAITFKMIKKTGVRKVTSIMKLFI